MVRVSKRKNNSVEEKYPRIKMNLFPLATKPDFRKTEGTKEDIIKNWLTSWIKDGLKNGQIFADNLLPIKADMAYFFGVGEGTVQNAVRKLEDEGLVISKQRVGTLIVGENSKSEMRKLTSKRDMAVEKIKNYIYFNGLKSGSTLPAMRDLVEILDLKRNTVRSALDYLSYMNIIEAVSGEEENKLWRVIKEISEDELVKLEENSTETLAQKVSAQIEDYIKNNLKVGDRLDAVNVWAKRYNVSDKTAYDAMQILFNRGVLKARRGRYGTIVVRMPGDSLFQPPKENSIFMPAEQAAIYSYKRIENFLRNKIKTEYAVGQKLPSMQEWSEMLDVSTNTIRKAMLQLAQDGYIRLLRGRFGGIYVIDIPEEETQSFKWLAVNPQYVKSYRN